MKLIVHTFYDFSMHVQTGAYFSATEVFSEVHQFTLSDEDVIMSTTESNTFCCHDCRSRLSHASFSFSARVTKKLNVIYKEDRTIPSLKFPYSGVGRASFVTRGLHFVNFLYSAAPRLTRV